MGNTVGSTNTNFCDFFSNEKDAYILGLWCADGYWWSSSIGLSNTNSELINKFRKFLERNFTEERIKYNRNHLFVNSRPLLREFIAGRNKFQNLRGNKIRAYFGGRFDGDGSIDRNLRNDCRIVYSNKKEAMDDQKILTRIGIKKTKIYHYRVARTFCLYVSRYEVKNFLKNISPYSLKLQKLVFVPRRDLVFLD